MYYLIIKPGPTLKTLFHCSFLKKLYIHPSGSNFGVSIFLYLQSHFHAMNSPYSKKKRGLLGYTPPDCIYDQYCPVSCSLNSRTSSLVNLTLEQFDHSLQDI